MRPAVGWWLAIRGPGYGTSRTNNPALHTAVRDRDIRSDKSRSSVSRTPNRSRCKRRSRRADGSRATPASRLKRTASNPLVLSSGDHDYERDQFSARHNRAADIELLYVKHPNLPSCSIQGNGCAGVRCQRVSTSRPNTYRLRRGWAAPGNDDFVCTNGAWPCSPEASLLPRPRPSYAEKAGRGNTTARNKTCLVRVFAVPCCLTG